MIRHVWSVLCRNTMIDSKSNNMSIFGVLEQVQGEIPRDALAQASNEAVIAIPFDFELASLWARDHAGTPEKCTGRMRIEAESGPPLGGGSIPIEFKEGIFRARSIAQSNVLPVRPKLGASMVSFVVELSEDGKWREVARVPLQVELKEAPPPASAQ